MALPPPETVNDLYLAAILEELRRIHELLEKPQPDQEPDEVELIEPVPARRKKKSRLISGLG